MTVTINKFRFCPLLVKFWLQKRSFFPKINQNMLSIIFAVLAPIGLAQNQQFLRVFTEQPEKLSYVNPILEATSSAIVCEYPRSSYPPTSSDCSKVCVFPYKGLPYQTGLCNPCVNPQIFFYFNSSKQCSQKTIPCRGQLEKCGVTFFRFSSVCAFEEGKFPITILKNNPGVIKSTYSLVMNEPCPRNPMTNPQYIFCNATRFRSQDCTGRLICRFRRIGIPLTSRQSCRCSEGDLAWKSVPCETTLIPCGGNQTNCKALLGVNEFCAFQMGKQPWLYRSALINSKNTEIYVIADKCPYKPVAKSHSPFIYGPPSGLEVCDLNNICSKNSKPVCAKIKGTYVLLKNICEFCKVASSNYTIKSEPNQSCP